MNHSCAYSVSFWPLELTREQRHVVAMISGLLSPSVLVTNVLVVMGLVQRKQLTNTLNYLYLCLSISDCFMAVITLPSNVLVLVFDSCNYAITNKIITKINARTSSYTIFIIALERYIKTNPNMGQTNRIGSWLTSKTGTVFMLFTSYSMALGGGLSTLSQSKAVATMQLLLSVAEILLCLACFSLYLRLYHRTKSAALESVVRVKRDDERSEIPLYVKRLAKTVFLILIALGMSILPVILLRVVTLIMKKSNTDIPQYFHLLRAIFAVFLRANSALNAVIIIKSNPVLKTYAVEKFCRLRTRTGSGVRISQAVSSKATCSSPRSSQTVIDSMKLNSVRPSEIILEFSAVADLNGVGTSHTDLSTV